MLITTVAQQSKFLQVNGINPKDSLLTSLITSGSVLQSESWGTPKFNVICVTFFQSACCTLALRISRILTEAGLNKLGLQTVDLLIDWTFLSEDVCVCMYLVSKKDGNQSGVDAAEDEPNQNHNQVLHQRRGEGVSEEWGLIRQQREPKAQKFSSTQWHTLSETKQAETILCIYRHEQIQSRLSGWFYLAFLCFLQGKSIKLNVLECLKTQKSLVLSHLK